MSKYVSDFQLLSQRGLLPVGIPAVAHALACGENEFREKGIPCFAFCFVVPATRAPL